MPPWNLHYQTRSNFIQDVPVTEVSRSEPWTNDQIVAAREAVTNIIRTGVVGDENANVQVLIGGRGQPPAIPSTDPDQVHIIIRQLMPADNDTILAGSPLTPPALL